MVPRDQQKKGGENSHEDRFRGWDVIIMPFAGWRWRTTPTWTVTALDAPRY
jgi:hypothetical protein